MALSDPYFIERNLYPNVDFYSGVILRAMGIPVNMFTVIFAMGRMPGWIANWKEVHDSGSALYRPRQVYMGQGERDYVRHGRAGHGRIAWPRRRPRAADQRLARVSESARTREREEPADTYATRR